MNWILQNWKTTVMGLGLLIFAVAHSIQTGQIEMQDVYAVLGAFGLTVAKDGNVSGSGK